MAPFRGFWQQQLYNALHKVPEIRTEIINRLDNLDYNNDKEIAHLRGMISRSSDKKNRRTIHLFFGCRNRECNLLAKETEVCAEFMTRFDAFSREVDTPKKYNYELLKEQKELVYSTLMNPEGRIYICGRVAMAHSVSQAMVQVGSEVMRQSGGIMEGKSKEEADINGEDLVNFWKDKGRYSQEIFG